MDIPYTVTARKDTGLFNSKVGIWLFLASEVMLFGGLFSGYVFLRIYADYPWPERALPIVPGLINTFVLIGSSVTVVFAWAALKMREWRKFQIYMGITIACAGMFMVLKGMEYKAKLEHQAVRMDDFVIIEGHAHYAVVGDDGKVAHADTKVKAKKLSDSGAKPFKANAILFKPETIDFSIARAHQPWVDTVLEQAGKRKSKLVTAENLFLYGSIRDYAGTEEEPISSEDRSGLEAELVAKYANAEEKVGHSFGERSLFIPAGTGLSYDLVKRAREIYVSGRSHNAIVRTAILKANWRAVKADRPDDKYWEQAPDARIDPATQLEEQFDSAGNCIAGSKVVSVVSTLSFRMDPPQPIVIDRGWIKRPVKAQDGKAELRDDTSFNAGNGEDSAAPGLLDSPLILAVDAIDFRWMVQKAEEAGKEPLEVIETSWIFSEENKHADYYKRIWKNHKARIAELEKELLEGYGRDKDGNAKRVPTETDRYRITWQDLVHYARVDQHEGRSPKPSEEVYGDLRPKFWDGFAGPNHKDEEIHELHAFPELEIPHQKVSLQSMFTPKWNTYYAVYFTITGLHGLHVIGGAIVLGYYLFCSKGLYRRNPEWLANRVEVGGLFWHFVDLVWIFLFPILYLM
tara:strand:+ start:1909 stop:3798 length:1890 start_codon:yes stop_codon:yes gene_type:complete